MQDDIIASLAQEVKQEVIENYLHERRLVEEQINHAKELAEQTVLLQEKLYRRFARIYELLSETSFIDQFSHIIGLEAAPFEDRFRKDPQFRKGLRFIKVWGLTHKARFKKLLVEAYRRLFKWNEAYKEGYGYLEAECRAVNHNLKRFEEGFDLLTILNFLKDMDVDFIEKKHWLSDNFTPQEMASIEQSLAFKPVRMGQFTLMRPPNLPKPNEIQGDLIALADFVFLECSARLKHLVK